MMKPLEPKHRILLVGADRLLVLAARCFIAEGFMLHAMVPSQVVEPGVAEGLRALDISVTEIDSVASPSAHTAAKEFAPQYILTLIFDERVPDSFCALASIAAMNMHPSPLPDVRTGNAWFWPIRLGLTTSAITVHHLTPDWDTGAIVYTQPFALGKTDTQGIYYERVQRALTPCCQGLAVHLNSGSVQGVPQGAGRYYPKLRVRHILVNWNESTRSIEALIRACNPYHYAETRFRTLTLHLIEASIVGLDHPIMAQPNGHTLQPGHILVHGEGVYCRTHDGFLRLDVLGVAERMVISGPRFVRMLGVCSGEKMVSLRDEPAWAPLLNKLL